jgi:hypothetical protein
MIEEGMSDAYQPALDIPDWVQLNIIAPGAPLHNPDHAHLEFADIAFLWAAGGFVKAGRTVRGQCEEVTFRCGAWQKGRQEQQMVHWFGHVPDYLITLDAKYVQLCSDAEFCALVEHELYHIGQESDAFGQPAFKKDGQPKLAMRGHDVEEFTGVVRRYGPSEDVAKMVEAAKNAPEVAKINIARACGTCLLKAA